MSVTSDQWCPNQWLRSCLQSSSRLVNRINGEGWTSNVQFCRVSHHSEGRNMLFRTLGFCHETRSKQPLLKCTEYHLRSGYNETTNIWRPMCLLFRATSLLEFNLHWKSVQIILERSSNLWCIRHKLQVDMGQKWESEWTQETRVLIYPWRKLGNNQSGGEHYDEKDWSVINLNYTNIYI